MEENQMPKKRNYERYLEGETWNKDPFDQQNLSGEQPLYQEPVYEQPGYMQPSYEPAGYEQPAGQLSYQPQTTQSYDGLEEPVSKGEWALCYFLMMIPCVGLIMMFVWAFSKTEKKSKSNFFKVQLIFMGVIFALYFVLILVVMCMGIAMA